MSDCLSPAQVAEITGYVRPGPQMRKLSELGYIVLGRDAMGRVKALATHPNDPKITAANGGETVRLNLS